MPEIPDFPFYLFDHVTIIPPPRRQSQLAAKTVARIQLGIKKFLQENDIEFFLCESPHNHYQPEPPEGWTAMRSQKRRVFFAPGVHPDVRNLELLLSTGAAREFPL